MNFAQKTILITGASSGIGFELAKQLDVKNARLILIARRVELLHQLKLELNPKADHLIYPCDVSDYQQVVSITQQINGQNISVDGLILNAGIAGGFEVNPLSIEQVQRQFAVNFWGALYFIEQFLPKMIVKKQGLIAGVSSLASYRGVPGAAGYSASKAALTRFLESIRIDLWGSGIIVSVISPGFVRSPMTEQNKYPMPFLMATDAGAKRIIRGLEQEKPEIHFPYRLSFIVKAAKLIPDHLYAWLMSWARRSKNNAG